MSLCTTISLVICIELHEEQALLPQGALQPGILVQKQARVIALITFVFQVRCGRLAGMDVSVL